MRGWTNAIYVKYKLSRQNSKLLSSSKRLLNETDPGSKQSAKIVENFYIILNLCLLDMNIYPINNKTDHFSNKNVFFYRKKLKVKKKLVFSLFLKFGFGAGSRSVISRNDPRIRIHIKMKRIQNTAWRNFLSFCFPRLSKFRRLWMVFRQIHQKLCHATRDQAYIEGAS